MKKTLLLGLLLVLATLLSSCGLANSVGQTAARTVQTVQRTIF
jgi:predicted small secreted protein